MAKLPRFNSSKKIKPNTKPPPPVYNSKGIPDANPITNKTQSSADNSHSVVTPIPLRSLLLCFHRHYQRYLQDTLAAPAQDPPSKSTPTLTLNTDQFHNCIVNNRFDLNRVYIIYEDSKMNRIPIITIVNTNIISTSLFSQNRLLTFNVLF